MVFGSVIGGAGVLLRVRLLLLLCTTEDRTYASSVLCIVKSQVSKGPSLARVHNTTLHNATKTNKIDIKNKYQKLIQK